jgi:predicted enzyme related to lactoylglutathione lyase
MPTGDTYTEFRLTPESKMPVAGMMQMQKEWGDIPSHWNIYFTVTDIKKTIETIESAGGKIVVPAFNVPSVGDMAVAQDSTGAHFSIAQWDFSNIDC